MANSGNSNSVFRGLQATGSIVNTTPSFAHPEQLGNNLQHNNQNQNTSINNQTQQTRQQSNQSLTSHLNTPRSPPAPVPPPSTSSNVTPLTGRSGIAGPSSSGRQIPTSVTTAQSPDHMSTLMAKLWFDHNVESSLISQKKEEHEKRMSNLRKQLEYISETNWKYPPIDKFIGQH